MIRIGVVGPANVGKSTITDYYTELMNGQEFTDYRPTVGLRILETERSVVVRDDDHPTRVNVQVWDVAGDYQYEYLYPRIAPQLDGVIIVIPATEPNQALHIRKYFEVFVDPDRMSPSDQVVVLSHNPQTPVPEEVTLNDRDLSAIPVYRTCLDSGTAAIFELLDSVVAKCFAKKSDAENEILDNLV